MTNNVVTKMFQQTPVRCVVDDKDGKVWFVAKDIVEGVGSTWNGASKIAHIPEKWSCPHRIGTAFGTKDMACLSEEGVNFYLFRSDSPLALPFQEWIAGDVLPQIAKTGGYSVPREKQPAGTLQNLQSELFVAETLFKSINMCNSSILSIIKNISVKNGVDTYFLPDYTVDAPGGMITGSSLQTKSLSELAKENGIEVSARVINTILIANGYLEERTRPSSKGKISKFKVLTSKGIDFGKNITCPNNPRETQPHYYVEKFVELMAKVGIMKGDR